MNALLELRKQMEVDFLKTKTYEEINDMFNQLNDKLKLAESEVKKFRLYNVSQQRELLIAFLEMNNWFSLEDRKNAEGVVDCYLKAINCG